MIERRIRYKIEMVNPADLESINSATLDVLSSKGAFFDNQEACDLLLSAGAALSDDGRLKIPEELVQDAIDKAPSSIDIYSRDGKQAMFLKEDYVYCGTGSDCLFVIDFKTGKRRPALKTDIETFTLLSDALPNIDFVLSMGVATEVPKDTADLHQFQAMVTNTTKPIVFTIIEPKNLPLLISFAERIVGNSYTLQNRPFLIHYAMPSPPLKHSDIALQNLICCARHSVPVVYASGTQMGASGPMTIAGGVVSANVDILAGLVVHQLANPGAPFIYGVGVSPLDMKTTVDSYGAPESDSADIVHAQLGKTYNLPTWGYAAATDSKVLDLQAAMEYMGSTFTGLLSHCHMLHDVGYLESGLTASCESIVFGNEVVEFARRILQPIEVNENTIPLDLLKKIGPNQTFLTESHTLKHLRDFFYSPLIDRNRHGKWLQKGGLTMLDRLKTRVEEILADHQSTPLDATITEEMTQVIATREKT
ncbi:MAG: trimethylamine methyltransferase family protein [Candidatus Hodarchaeota archaeon]